MVSLCKLKFNKIDFLKLLGQSTETDKKGIQMQDMH